MTCANLSQTVGATPSALQARCDDLDELLGQRGIRRGDDLDRKLATRNQSLNPKSRHEDCAWPEPGCGSRLQRPSTVLRSTVGHGAPAVVSLR